MLHLETCLFWWLLPPSVVKMSQNTRQDGTGPAPKAGNLLPHETFSSEPCFPKKNNRAGPFTVLGSGVPGSN